MPDIGWLSPMQVSELLGVSISTVRAMLRDGRLRARKIRGSRLIRIARADAENLLEERDTTHTPGTAGTAPGVNSEVNHAYNTT